MYEAATSIFPQVDAAILTATVADYTPNVSEQKIKRKKTGEMTLKLKPTKDIAAELGKMKKEQFPKKILVGFALETNNEQENATGKKKSRFYCSELLE